MEFRKLRLEDKEEIEKYTVRSGENNCEFTFYNLFMWQETYGNRYAAEDGIMFLRVGEEGNYIYSLPMGDLDVGMEKLAAHSGEKHPAIWGQDGPLFEEFRKKYGKYYEIKELRDEFDYLYSREDLAFLSGKKYHSKRNHISAFSKKYDWHFETVTAENLCEVKECAEKWYAENGDRMDGEMLSEQKGLGFLFDNFDSLGVKGGAVRANGEIVAFTFGSAINSDTFDVYIEKALSDYSEAYSVINKEFAEKMLMDYKYINREDDLGLEGLRKAKLSYHPVKFVKKYLCIKKNHEELMRIYKEAFGESPEFDDLFFDEFGACAETLSKDGKTVSLLFKIPCEINGKKYYYVYAAATEKNMRGRGYMSALLQKVKKSSDAPLFLVPSKESLVKFYEKCGFCARRAVSSNGEIKISVSKKHEQLSKLCDNCPEKFTVMFSNEAEDVLYEFPFAMQ